mgnify:CR=1 FL=1
MRGSTAVAPSPVYALLSGGAQNQLLNVTLGACFVELNLVKAASAPADGGHGSKEAKKAAG